MSYCPRVHQANNSCNYDCSHQYNHGRLLQLLPAWPGHFFHQLFVGISEVGGYFIHAL